MASSTTTAKAAQEEAAGCRRPRLTTIRRLCLFDDDEVENGAVELARVEEPFDSAPTPSGPAASLPRTVEDLEGWLEGCLRNDDGDDVQHPSSSVMYATRTEAMLLKCRRRRPGSLPYGTLLGILEDRDEEDDEGSDSSANNSAEERKIPLTLRAWRMRAPSSKSPSNGNGSSAAGNGDKKGGTKWKSTCGCPVPGSDWSRRRLVSRAGHQPGAGGGGNGGTKSQSDGRNSGEAKGAAAAAVVDWFDLRSPEGGYGSGDGNVHPLAVPTKAAACHLLRSLLPEKCRRSSPWPAATSAPGATEEGETGAEPPDACVVVLDGDDPPPKLVAFRVADACPSWYLFSVCYATSSGDEGNVLLPKLPPAVAASGNSNGGDSLNERCNCTLLVYRRLPPRPHLSSVHPVTGEIPSSPGCLWETLLAPKRQQQSPPSEEAGAGAAKGEGEGQQEGDKDEEQELVTRLVAPPYVNALEEYPKLLEPLLEHFDVIRSEAEKIGHWTAWPEQQHYASPDGEGDEDAGTAQASWTVFPLCYCFPADDVGKRKWVPATCGLVPRTAALIREHLGDSLRTALFSRLRPGAVLQAHTGWQDLANHVMRVHLPLTVPPGNLCGTWVDGCVEHHSEGVPLCFDDSKTHWAFNYSGGERIVLILDLERPSTLPVGTAVGGHSEELDSFIESMTAATSAT